MVRFLAALIVVAMAGLAGCVNDANIHVWVNNYTQNEVSVGAQIVRIGDATLMFDRTYDVPANSSRAEPSKVHLPLGTYYLNATAGDLSESIDRGLSDSSGGWSIGIFWDRISSSVSVT